jgi:hypothetical protein
MAIVLAPDVVRRFAIGGSVYMTLCVALALVDRLRAAAVEWVPRWLLFVVVSIIGPPVSFFFWGIGAWRPVLGTGFCVALCLALSWFYWRRYPESELFVVGLLGCRNLGGIGVARCRGRFVVPNALSNTRCSRRAARAHGVDSQDRGRRSRLSGKPLGGPRALT